MRIHGVFPEQKAVRLFVGGWRRGKGGSGVQAEASAGVKAQRWKGTCAPGGGGHCSDCTQRTEKEVWERVPKSRSA